jgi:hypothetical protein
MLRRFDPSRRYVRPATTDPMSRLLNVQIGCLSETDWLLDRVGRVVSDPTSHGLTVRQRQPSHAISQYRDSVRISEVLLIRLPVAAP